MMITRHVARTSHVRQASLTCAVTGPVRVVSSSSNGSAGSGGGGSGGSVAAPPEGEVFSESKGLNLFQNKVRRSVSLCLSVRVRVRVYCLSV